jgi:hypothetical protein
MGGKQTDGNSAKNRIMHATDKKDPEIRLYVPVHGFRDLIKQKNGQVNNLYGKFY